MSQSVLTTEALFALVNGIGKKKITTVAGIQGGIQVLAKVALQTNAR